MLDNDHVIMITFMFHVSFVKVIQALGSPYFLCPSSGLVPYKNPNQSIQFYLVDKIQFKEIFRKFTELIK